MPVCGLFFSRTVVSLCFHRPAFGQETAESLCGHICLGNDVKRLRPLTTQGRFVCKQGKNE